MAKNIFGVRDDADQIDGSAFVVRTIDPALKEKMETFGKEAESFANEYRPSQRLALLRTFALVVGIVLLILARMKGNEAGVGSFGALIRAYPIPLISAFLLWGIAVGLVVYERISLSKARTSDAAQNLKERSKAIDKEAYAALGVPDGAISLDLLTSSYRTQNGEPKNIVHTAFAFHAWSENGTLYLSDIENVVAIPTDAITEFTRIEHSVNFYFWNKAESPRQYGIRANYAGTYTAKGVVAAHIQSELGEYELLIPPYEMENFLRLTGKEIENTEQKGKE